VLLGFLGESSPWPRSLWQTVVLVRLGLVRCYSNGKMVGVAYASRTLIPAERVYCTTRKEQLAMVYGLRQFRPYILGYRTVVRSDHAALMYLKRAIEPVGQQARWLNFIEQFTLDLRHRKGASHNNAEALSCRPCERQGDPCRQCSGRSNDRGLGSDRGVHSDPKSVVRGTGSAEE